MILLSIIVPLSGFLIIPFSLAKNLFIVFLLTIQNKNLQLLFLLKIELLPLINSLIIGTSLDNIFLFCVSFPPCL